MFENIVKRKERIKSLIATLNEGLHEREEHIAVALLAAVAGLNVFLLGPPGTAKSLLARRIKSAFADSQESGKYFEYLMQRFSTPDELFGPVSLTELKKDRYTRKTEGFLPSAHFAFLDEIWKSGPGILNTLLTLINEKLFRNGADLEKAPLKMLITASNETPLQGQGLEALYDRFIVRMYIPPMAEVKNFESLLGGKHIDGDVDCQKTIKPEELKKWREQIEQVTLSPETLHIIRAIRAGLEKEENKIYISDRRWKESARLLKASAFLCDRNETNFSDTLLLRHCLWTTYENRDAVAKIVEGAVRESGFSMDISGTSVIEKMHKLDKESQKELFQISDESGIHIVQGLQCYRFIIHWNEYNHQTVAHQLHREEIYVPITRQASPNDFFPINKLGQDFKMFKCRIEKGMRGNKYVVSDTSHGRPRYLYLQQDGEWRMKMSLIFEPQAKVTIPKPVSPWLIEAMKGHAKSVAKEFEELIGQVNSNRAKFSAEMDSPFIALAKQQIALEGIDQQVEILRAHKEDCGRLIERINNAKSNE